MTGMPQAKQAVNNERDNLTIPPFRAAGLRWVDLALSEGAVKSLMKGLRCSHVLAKLLLRLGIKNVVDAKRFLQPRLADLEDPFELTHLREAVDRLVYAIQHQERIVVLGDYDVDGITSTTLLVSILRRLGIAPAYIVPRRMEEGYGLSHEVIARALEEAKPDLFIALDCGTNAVEEVESLRCQGVDVIILDHHRSKSALPKEAIIVNPHVFDEGGASWRNLSAVGLVFKVVHGLLKHLRALGCSLAQEILLKDYLDFVAMGTIADLVPLLHENRILTRHGLKRLSMSRHPGVRALFQASGLELGQEVQPVDVSFKLGPRINASGRLADAALPLEILLSSDYEWAYSAANELNLLNRQRQDIEKKIAQEAEQIVEESQLHLPALVVYSPNWHSGVVGIVAGRLARRFYRPAIVLGAEGDWAKGSGRSVPGINLVSALGEASNLLKSWGGHPMAVGVSLDPIYLERFKDAFNQAISLQLAGQLLEPTLEIAAWLNVKELTLPLLEELEGMRPFGEGNLEPILGIQKARLHQPVTIFGDKHFRFQLKVGDDSLSGVAWNRADHLPPYGLNLDLAVKFGWNVWNGRRAPQIELINWRLSQ